MQYDPTPLGIFNMSMSGYGGGGLCSAKMTPYGEWKSACYDYDFYDGSSSSPDRVPAGPSVWYNAIWARDLQQIASTCKSAFLSYSTIKETNHFILFFTFTKISELTLFVWDH